jgi:hypothetical protein
MHASDAYATSDFIASNENERPVEVVTRMTWSNIAKFRYIKRTVIRLLKRMTVVANDP